MSPNGRDGARSIGRGVNDYVEVNPVKEGKNRQTWPFVVPYIPEGF